MSEDAREYILAKATPAVPPLAPKPLAVPEKKPPAPVEARDIASREASPAPPAVQFPPRGLFNAFHGIGASAVAPAGPSSAEVVAQLKERHGAAAESGDRDHTANDFELALALALEEEEAEAAAMADADVAEAAGTDADAARPTDRVVAALLEDLRAVAPPAGGGSSLGLAASGAGAATAIDVDADRDEVEGAPTPVPELAPVPNRFAAPARAPVGVFEEQLHKIREAVHTAAGFTTIAAATPAAAPAPAPAPAPAAATATRKGTAASPIVVPTTPIVIDLSTPDEDLPVEAPLPYVRAG